MCASIICIRLAFESMTEQEYVVYLDERPLLHGDGVSARGGIAYVSHPFVDELGADACNA